MVFAICMFICNALIPLVMLIGGYCMYKRPPKEINGVIGYRTKMSMINRDTWQFAHDYCGRLWVKIGWILLIPTVIVQIPFMNKGENAVGIVTGIVETIQVIVLIGSIVPVERALGKTFDKNGKRK